MDIVVQIYFQIFNFISKGYIPRSGISGYYDNAILVLGGTPIIFSKVDTQIYIPINSLQVFLCSTVLPMLIILNYFILAILIIYCGFNLHFADD
jgi:hypothetical protein